MSALVGNEVSWHAAGVAAGRRALLLAIPLLLGLSSATLAAEPPKTEPPKAAAKPATKKAEPKKATPRLTVAQIVQKHVAARGGLEAWRAVQALSVSGKMDAGAGDSRDRAMRVAQGTGTGNLQKTRREIAAAAAKGEAEKQVQLPFRLTRERPNRSRLEIDFAGKTAVQVYDGKNGWKLRPYLNRDDVEPYTAEEAKAARTANDDLADPLIDYAKKGTKVALEGIEPVEGKDAYKLKLTTKAGAVQRVWVDARTFLDVKVEGVPRRMDGKLHDVWVYQRDFRPVRGLMIPFVVETAVDGYPQTHKIVLDQVAVNPKLDAATFAKPRPKVG